MLSLDVLIFVHHVSMSIQCPSPFHRNRRRSRNVTQGLHRVDLLALGLDEPSERAHARIRDDDWIPEALQRDTQAVGRVLSRAIETLPADGRPRSAS